jgi:hypothetical protein
MQASKHTCSFNCIYDFLAYFIVLLSWEEAGRSRGIAVYTEGNSKVPSDCLNELFIRLGS